VTSEPLPGDQVPGEPAPRQTPTTQTASRDAGPGDATPGHATPGEPASGEAASGAAALGHAASGEAVTIRPRKIRRVCWALAPVVVVFFIAIGSLLSGSTGEGSAVFQSSDRIAMMALGLFVAAGILLFTRPRVVADAAHIKITNVIGGYDLPWEVVRAVRFERGNPWVSLELQDDDVVAVMAIQMTDKEYAVAGVRTLRALLETHQAGRPSSQSS
jgi:hypothetical protein